MNLIAQFWPEIAGAFVFLVTALGLYIKGGKDADAKHEIKKAKTDAKAHDRIDDLTPVDPDNRRDIVDRLLEHAKR